MKRGRKSLSMLSVVAPVATLPARPHPPVGLSAEMAARWTAIIDDWPVDHWRPSDLRLLEDLVVTESYVHDCDELIAIEGMTAIGANGGSVAHPAVIMRRGHLATVLGLQRALRLCPSTRTRAEKAGLHERAGAGGKRPWEA